MHFDDVMDAVTALDDGQLSSLAVAVADEQHARALSAGDPEAVIDRAMEESFDHRGEAIDPFVDGALLVCPGSLRARSRVNHDCRFVVVDDVWVWQHPRLVADRMDPEGKHSKRSITLVPAVEGTQVTAVSMRRTTEGHKRQAAVSWVVRDGVLVEDDRGRVRIPDGHR